MNQNSRIFDHQLNETTMTIEITTSIEKEITTEINKAIKSIEKEMAYSADLRNYEAIARNSKYIAEMKQAIKKGII